MKFTIRPVKVEDAVFINQIRTMDGVRETTLGIISERPEKIQEEIKNLPENKHVLVAEVKESEIKKVAGMVELTIRRNPRMRHVGKLLLMVNEQYQKNGIGKELMNNIIDLADNWLMLLRLELTVFADDERAISLYNGLGFEIEGTLKYAAVKDGKYADLYKMARINKNLIKE